jgi:hypothetical protein
MTSGVAIALVGLDRLLNFHVTKLFRIKDFSTLQAFDKLDVVVPGDNAHSRVFTDGRHVFSSICSFYDP